MKEKYKGNIHKFEHKMNTQDGLSKLNLHYFENLNTFLKYLPSQTNLVVVEMLPESISLPKFSHPKNATYLLGRETTGLEINEINEIKEYFSELNKNIPIEYQNSFSKTAKLDFIKIETPESLNVSVCGAIIMYDRHFKQYTNPIQIRTTAKI